MAAAAIVDERCDETIERIAADIVGAEPAREIVDAIRQEMGGLQVYLPRVPRRDPQKVREVYEAEGLLAAMRRFDCSRQTIFNLIKKTPKTLP